MIRSSTDSDLNAIAAIYAHHVLTSTATFELDAPTPAEMRNRRLDVLLKGLPFLVAEQNGEVAGFAYCNWFKPRAAFRFSAEDSIYLSPHAQGQGLGKALLNALCLEAEKAGIRRMIAVIGDSENAASIGAHQSVGFHPTGTLRSVGWKFGRWLDLVMMEKPLGLGDSQAPIEPN